MSWWLSLVSGLCDLNLWSHPWLWPWIFKVKFWNSHISGMGGLIDMEQNGCELIGCWTPYVTLISHWSLIFKFKFLNSCISRIGGLFDLKGKGYELTAWCSTCLTLTFGFIHDLYLGFSRWNFDNNHISGIASDITSVHGKKFLSCIYYMRRW